MCIRDRQQGPPRQKQGPQRQQQGPQKQGVPPPQKQESNGNEFNFKDFFENYTYEILCAVAVLLAILYTLYTNDFDINKIFKSDK